MIQLGQAAKLLPHGEAAARLIASGDCRSGNDGVRAVGEGLALDIVNAFLTAQFEGGRHATRVEMTGTLG